VTIWNESEDSLLGLECSGTPHCDFCEASLRILCAKPHTFFLSDGKRAYAIDVEMTCPECGLWEAFGVAISEKHYTRVIEGIAKARERQKEETWVD